MNYINFREYQTPESQNAVTFRFKESDGQLVRLPHWHPYYEVMFVTEGIYTVICNGQSIHSDRPGVYLFMPHSLHQIEADMRCVYKRYQIIVSKSLVHRLEGDILDMHPYLDAQLLYLSPDEAELAALRDVMEHMQAAHDDTGLLMLHAGILLRHMLNALSRGHGGMLMGTHFYIQSILEYISHNLSAPPTVAELAKRCGVCQSKFYSDFKETVGVTYKKYLTTIRQDYARSMLNCGASIVKTSLECGYCSEAHFIKAFREYWGMTPGEYIKNRQEQR